MKKSKDDIQNRADVESQYPLVSSSPHYDPCIITRIDITPRDADQSNEDAVETYVLGESSTLGKTILNLREWLETSFRLLKDQMTKRRVAEEQIQKGNRKLELVYEGICRAMNAILAAKDPYTALHQARVAKLATSVSIELRLSNKEVEGIRIASLLHDIGKITVPAEILSKSGTLSDHEFGLIREHPQVGFTILKAIEFPWDISEMVLQHHERLDGSGYPSGLKDGEIMFGAKILAVADVIEAVSFHRPYREARGTADALKHIQEYRNVLYDSSVVEACLQQFYQSNFSF